MHRGRKGTAVVVVAGSAVVAANASASSLLGAHVGDDIASVLRPPGPLSALLTEQLSGVLTSASGRLIDCDALRVGTDVVITARAADDPPHRRALGAECSTRRRAASTSGTWWSTRWTWSSGLPQVLEGVTDGVAWRETPAPRRCAARANQSGHRARPACRALVAAVPLSSARRRVCLARRLRAAALLA